MSVNVQELLGPCIPKWIGAYLAEGSPELVPNPFWVIPVEQSDPTYDELCKVALQRLKTTEFLEFLSHESMIFCLVKDEGKLKLCIGSQDASPSAWKPNIGEDNFSFGDLNFLQLAHLVTKHAFPARAKIPVALVNATPIFEDDLLGYFPEVYILAINDSALTDSLEILCLKALLAMEADKAYVASFGDSILNVGYAIPPNNHAWIFDQLLSAVRSQRLVNFYLEIYKLFEFFFPLESIFNLADRLGYTKSELVLLDYCRGTLSWNVNHQRGARSATSYATIRFAEICLDESFEGSEMQQLSFKERAVEKLTTARHALTHQDFRPSSVSENELLYLTAGLLAFLRDAFTEYGTKLESRRKRPSKSQRQPEAPRTQSARKLTIP